MARIECEQCTWTLDVEGRDAGRNAAMALFRHVQAQHRHMPTPLEYAERKLEPVIMRERYSPTDILGRTQPPVVKGVTDKK